MKTNGYLELSNAIILMAVDDYRTLRRKEGYDIPPCVTLESLEKFFKSDWGAVLSRNLSRHIFDKISKESF